VCKRDCRAKVWGEEKKEEDEEKISSFGSLLKGALTAAKK
jgi:hypothetical protein